MPAALVFLQSTRCEAQTQHLVISDADPCRKCTIEVRQVAVLQTGRGPIPILAPMLWTTQGPSGRIVMSLQDEATPLVYTREGRFERFLGREGRGPGEFIAPYVALFLEGDSLLVIDSGTRRASVFDQRFRLIRSFPIPLSVSAVAPVSGNHLIVYGRVHSPERFGMPFHILDPTGTILISFGPVPDIITPANPAPRYRLAPSRAGGVWSIPEYEYVLTRWGPTGEEELVVHRRGRGLLPGRFAVPTPDEPPVPWILGVQEFSIGLVKVYFAVPSETWRRAFAPQRQGPHGPYAPIDSWDALYDTQIEVLDVAHGRVVASTRVRELLFPVQGSDLAISYEDTRPERPRVALWQLNLLGYGGSKE
jgi:hypothetical protein